MILFTNELRATEREHYKLNINVYNTYSAIGPSSTHPFIDSPNQSPISYIHSFSITSLPSINPFNYSSVQASSDIDPQSSIYPSIHLSIQPSIQPIIYIYLHIPTDPFTTPPSKKTFCTVDIKRHK